MSDFGRGNFMAHPKSRKRIHGPNVAALLEWGDAISGSA